MSIDERIVATEWYLGLAVVRPGTLPEWTGSVAMAALLSAFARIDPELAASLHDMDGPKPYTVSPLSGEAEPSDRPMRLVLSEGSKVWVRVTATGPGLGPFHHLLGRMGSQLVLVDRAVCEVVDVTEQRSFTLRDLQGPADGEVVRVRFRSPTAFKRPDGPLELLPHPIHILSSAERRWRLWVGEPPACEASTVWVRAHRVRTVPVRLPRAPLTGFVGSVDLQAPAEQAQGLWALCRYLEVVGCGIKTSQGMGQVSVEAPGPTRRDVPARDPARRGALPQGGTSAGPPGGPSPG